MKVLCQVAKVAMPHTVCHVTLAIDFDLGGVEEAFRWAEEQLHRYKSGGGAEDPVLKL